VRQGLGEYDGWNRESPKTNRRRYPAEQIVLAFLLKSKLLQLLEFNIVASMLLFGLWLLSIQPRQSYLVLFVVLETLSVLHRVLFATDSSTN
jgi:hypothetical protein